MMKRFILALCFLTFTPGLSVISAQASDDTIDHNDRVDHYAHEEITTSEDALKAFETQNGKILDLLSADTLSDSDLETIHEISYTLEAAIDRLIQSKFSDAGRLNLVDEAVQALHYASENHDEPAVREWFPKLQAAIESLEEKNMAAQPQEKGVYEIVIKDHTFTPDTLHVPAGEKIKLIVHNQDPTPEEFESDDFRREKIIPGNSKGTIFVSPLKPGKYHFFGEFNLDKANGYLIAE